MDPQTTLDSLQLDTVGIYEELSILTPVHQRREWLENVFKKKGQLSAKANSDIKEGLVHDRLQWLAEEKRKSMHQNSPDNKDARENIPPHLVEGRKKWLDDQLRNMSLQQQQAFIAHLKRQFVESQKKEADNQTEKERWEVESDDNDDDPLARMGYDMMSEDDESQVYETFDDQNATSGYGIVTDDEEEDYEEEEVDVDGSYGFRILAGCEAERERRQRELEESARADFEESFVYEHVDYEEHPEEPPRIGRPKRELNLLSPTVENSSLNQKNPGSLSVVTNSCGYYSPATTSPHSASSSLADYARQSCQTMARAHLPVAGCSEEELIITTDQRSMLLSPMGMASPGSFNHISPIIKPQAQQPTEATTEPAVLSPRAPAAASPIAPPVQSITQPVATKCAPCCIM